MLCGRSLASFVRGFFRALQKSSEAVVAIAAAGMLIAVIFATQKYPADDLT
jgi:hypothetical protein